MRNDSAPLTAKSPRWIQVLVMHGHAAECDALCDAIADAGAFRVMGTARNSADAVVLMQTLPADVIVLDLASIGADVAGLLLASRAGTPRSGILLLADESHRAAVDDLVARGAGGFIDPTLLATQLAPALRTIGMGRRYLPEAAAGTP